MTTDKDPLAITASDSLSLFGESVGNIEFVIESDDDVEVIETGTNEDNDRSNMSKPGNGNSETEEFILLTTDIVDDIKEEIKIEENPLQVPFNQENETSSHTVNRTTLKTISNKKKNSRCYVPNCTIEENEEDTLLWFKVPYDKNMKKIWDICIDRVDKRLGSEDVICHQHFSENDIIYSVANDNVVVGATLKENAVPCIKFHKECCVPNCKNKTGPMYCFPVLRTSNFHLWIYMIKNPELRKLKMKDVLRYRVCSLHFESDCFENRFTLRSTAAPTLHLPELNINSLNATNVYQEVMEPVPSTFIVLECAYGNCSNTSQSGKKMFRFPRDQERCIAWFQACRKEGILSTSEAPTGKLGVCEDHFKEDQFVGGRLKIDAIPTKEGTTENIRKSKSFSEEDSSSEATKNSHEFVKGISKHTPFAGICSYKDCYNKVTEDNPFFSFPLNIEQGIKWLKACGLIATSPSSQYQILKNQQICSKHFEEHMFESKNKLKPEAFPIPYKKDMLVRPLKKEGDEDNKTETTIQTVNKAKQGYQYDSSKIIRCAVSNCPNNYGVLPGKGKFPNPSKDPERFNIWLRLIDNPTLKDLPSEVIYEKYMVCLKHFEPKFYMNEGRVGNLSNEAVPTKHLTANCEWLFKTEYYKNRLQTYFQINDGGDENTICILEEGGLRFPKTGHYLYAEKKPDSKRKFPYEVYKFFKTGYGLNHDIMIGENIKIHTAIIIDDDDECEREVLQQLLDKRRKY